MWYKLNQCRINVCLEKPGFDSEADRRREEWKLERPSRRKKWKKSELEKRET